MEDKSLAYLKTKLGSYALTPKLNKKYPEPKNFLVKMTPKAEAEHKDELKDTKVKCTTTKTGAKFCIFNFDKNEIEGMEMCAPIYEMKTAIKEKRMPSIEECRAKDKNWFLVLKCKPESVCK